MIRRGTILVVDDSDATLEVIRRNLEAAGHRVTTAGAVADAIAALDAQPFDLVVTDMKMPKVGGLELVRHVRENHKDTEVTVITGYPSVDGAVEAMKRGAVDYLTKPFTDQELLDTVSRALDRVELRRAAPAAEPLRHRGLIGESRAMRRILAQLDRVSKTRAPVLITGESGTGKELVARAIHYGSARSSAPFVPVNCGGIPHELAESELFGHLKGAFTGATEARAGFFITAEGGTIFLDEISETSRDVQVKLLRVLQEGEVHMVGSPRARAVDVRVVAATNKDLGRLVEKGSFREDLYFRVNVINIDVPPLRDRGDDMLLLLRHFSRRFAAELGRAAPTFTPRALETLRRHSWPGNVRELENLVQRLLVMTDSDTIDAPDLPEFMRFSAHAGDDVERTLAEVEAAAIRRVLAHVDGNKSQAARILGIDRKTLRAKLGPGDDGAD